MGRAMKLSIVLLWQLLVAGAWANTALQTGLDIRLVGTVPALQRAINDGVKHVVLTEHISAISAQQEIEGSGESLDSAIGSIQPDTKSITGNCAELPSQSPAVAQLTLNEDVPPNACVIEVEEDFMELPLRTGRGATELWLNNFYIVTHIPRITPNASATTILHKDGDLYITNTVFQGRDYWNRAIDLSSSDGGFPLLYVGDSVFSDFRRDHAAAIRGNPGTAITVQSTEFHRLTVTEMQLPDVDPIKWARVFGSAIGLFENALLWLMDVTVEDQVVLGEPAESKVFTFESEPVAGDEWTAEEGGNIYSQTALEVWDHSLNMTVAALDENTRPNKFLSAGSILQGIREEQQALLAQATGADTPEAAGGAGTTVEEEDPDAQGDTASEPDVIGGFDNTASRSTSDDGNDTSVYVIVFVTLAIACLLLAAVVIAVMVLRKRRRDRHAAAAAQQFQHDLKFGSVATGGMHPHDMQMRTMSGSHVSAHTHQRSAQHLHLDHHANNSTMSASSHTHSTRNGGVRFDQAEDHPANCSMTSAAAMSTRPSHVGDHISDMMMHAAHAPAHMGPAGVHGMRGGGRPPSAPVAPVQLPPHMNVYGVGAHANKELLESASPLHGGAGGVRRPNSGPRIYVDGPPPQDRRETPQQLKERQALARQPSGDSVARVPSVAGSMHAPQHRNSSQSMSDRGSEIPAWGKGFASPTDSKPPPHGSAMHQQTISTRTFDATFQSSGLPAPDKPGMTLNKKLLKSALDSASANRELFLGRFELLGEAQRREGGQGVVQFAKVWGTGDQVAIKFFWNRKSFDCEEALYSKESLRGLMPAITLIENNDSGAASTREGWRYPPFIVVERGESLDEWQMRIQPDFPTIVQMLLHMTERVSTLHEQGIVHRDLKPGNILWRPAQHSWTLIDFGCAAEIGLPARLTFSPVYAPPETLRVFHGGATTITADAAVDIWAIGVMAFELLLHKRAFSALAWPKFDVMYAALGKRAYDWEAEVGTFKVIPELRVLSKVVHACLQRDPMKRPSATELLNILNSLYDASLTQSAMTSM